MPKFNITLKKIDPEKICQKYGITIKNIPKNSTIISDLTLRINHNDNYSFLDSAKKEHSCIFTMVDSIMNEKLPKSTQISCYWCKHNFNTIPLGCPIEYVSSKLTKHYYSEITKDKYSIRGSITKNGVKTISNNSNNSIDYQLGGTSYYITDGIFCSFNCCLAFIKDNWNNNLYSNSQFYLNKIHNDLFKKSDKIIAAPSWRLLQKFGGNLSIQDFRNSFNKVEYINTNDYLTEMPILKPIGFIFEKKIKF